MSSRINVPISNSTGTSPNSNAFFRGVGYGKWVHIDGWSEAVVEYLRALETAALN